MGSEMGEHPDLCEQVTSWVTEVSNIPVWAKMTPNITNIKEPSLAAVRGGAVGISAINTILSVIGVDLNTLRPMPTVEGHTVPGGYSSQAVRPIALRMVSQLALGYPRTFPSAASAALNVLMMRLSLSCWVLPPFSSAPE